MQVPGLGSITSVSAGGSQSLARASDGTVWFWGATNPPPNTLDGQPSPVQVSGISDAVSVTAAPDAVFAVRSDGSLWDWGVNTVGQLGDGTLTSRFVPAQVEGIADVTSVSHSGALLVGTSVQCTGVCLSIGDVMSWAGGALAFPITLNEPAATDVTITVWENEDTRTYDDFKTVTIKPGHLETFLTVGAKNITSLPATNVVFAATLYSVTGASIGRLGGVGLVQPCCLAPSQVLVGAARIVEPDVGKVTVKVPLLLSVVDKVDKVTVQYRTSDGTATAGTDYVAKPPVTRPPATVGIRRGARRAAVAVVVLGDTNPEATETFSINFTNPMFATLPSATAPVSIIDNGD
ncbi:MAG TPA: Calx-beta domain-containing protein [Acidimicrobiia bacterium]